MAPKLPGCEAVWALTSDGAMAGAPGLQSENMERFNSVYKTGGMTSLCNIMKVS